MTCCKVSRTAEKFGVESVVEGGLDANLVRRWNGDGYEKLSVKRLAAFFNMKVMEIEYDRVGLSTVESRLRSDYEALSGELSDMEKQSVSFELEDEGVRVDELLECFVSGPTMYRHLTGCIGAEKEKDRAKDWERDSMLYDVEDLQSTVREATRSLHNKGDLEYVGDELDVDVTVFVSDGENEVRLDRALDRGFVTASEDHHSGEDDDGSDGDDVGSVQADLL